MKKGTFALFSIFCCLCLSLGLYLTLSVTQYVQQTTVETEEATDAANAFYVRVATVGFTSATDYSVTGPSSRQTGEASASMTDTSSIASSTFSVYWHSESGSNEGFGNYYSANGSKSSGKEEKSATSISSFYMYYDNFWGVRRYAEIIPNAVIGYNYCGYTTTISNKNNRDSSARYNIYKYGSSVDTSLSSARSGASSNISGLVYIVYRKSYFITFEYNDGSGYNFGIQTRAGVGGHGLDTPSRTGYTFKGWSTSSTATSADFSSSTLPDSWVNASWTFYAVWEPNTYTVTLDKDGGTGGTDNFTIKYNYSYPDVTIPSKTGYNFQGYYTSKNGGGTRYYNELGQTLISNHERTSNLTLYAYWTLATFWVDINVFSPEGVQDYVSGYFDVDFYDSGGRYSGTYSNCVNEPSYDTLGYGSTMKFYNIRTYTDGKYRFASITANNSVTDNGDGSYTYTVTGSDSVNIQMEWIEYSFDLNGLLDETWTDQLSTYGLVDIKIDGAYSATDVNDFYITTLHYGQTYEILNIRPSTDRVYKGVAEGKSLSGTINTGNVSIHLIFNTDYWTYEAASSFAGGSGTQSNPYQISNAAQLAYLAKLSQTSSMTGQYFRQTADIDLAAHVWKPIGNPGFHFEGIYDGGLHVIRNLWNSATASLSDCQGLFSVLQKGGTVRNILLTNVNIHGTNTIAALIAAFDTGGLVENCMVTNVNLTSQSATAGGLVGANYAGTIKSCYVENVFTDTSGNSHFGGLVGFSQHGMIIDSSAINCNIDISASYIRCGALVGHDDGGNTIQACYAQTSINGINYKQFYGDSNAWGNWSVGEDINAGLPVQSPLFAIGGFTDSATIYTRLKAMGFTEM